MRRGYGFPTDEGVFKAVLDCKRYGKTRKQTECDGQTGYTMHILDDIVDSIIKDIFAKMKGVSKSEVVNAKYANELELRKARLIMLNADYGKASDNLALLKAEVVKSIRGRVPFPPRCCLT